MSSFVSTALVLLSLSISQATLGPRGDTLRTVLALCAIGPVLVDLLRRGDHVGSGWLRWLGTLLGALVFLYRPDAVGLLALSAILLLPALGRDGSRKGHEQLCSSLSLTAFGYAVFVAVRDHLSLWPLLYNESTRITSWMSSLIGVEARLGPSYSGVLIGVAFALGFVARASVAPIARRKTALLATFLLLLAPLIFLAMRSPSPWAIRIGVSTHFLSWRVFQYTYLLIPLALFIRSTPLPVTSSVIVARVPRSRALQITASALLVAGIGLLGWGPGVPARVGRVLLDARGDFSLDPPRWGQYGQEARRGASLASLPRLLEAYGFTFTVCDSTITAAVLERHDALVVMNPTRQFDPVEHDAVWRFVRDGGGLMILGDHTNIKGTMGPLNALMEPIGVRVEFDSAIPLAPRWTWYSCMRIHPHAVTRDVRDETDVKVSVGASLALPVLAMPLLTGRDAYSDAGNWENERGAFLGNMRYDASEALGDLPLACVVGHGRGRVVVFGDTSPFQRGATYGTHEFIVRLFTFLVAPGAAITPAAARAVGAGAAFLGGAALVLGGAVSAPIAAVSGIIGAILFEIVGERGRVDPPSPEEESPIAWIDLAHGNRIDLHVGLPTSIGGLSEHFLRSGRLPLGMRRFDMDKLGPSSVFVTIAPALPFRPEEVEALWRFVERGGLLVVATGYEEMGGARSLLARFGYRILDIPVGAAHEATAQLAGQRALMHEAWPVKSTTDRAEVWVSCWEFPLVTFEAIGKGGLIVIGDSYFLCDVKTEGTEQYIESNIDFLRVAFETAEQRTASKGGQ